MDLREAVAMNFVKEDLKLEIKAPGGTHLLLVRISHGNGHLLQGISHGNGLMCVIILTLPIHKPVQKSGPG
jgi:hypothetical protein